MHTITIEQKVRNSVRWLDEHVGPNSSVPANWRELVDVDQLAMTNTRLCVAGQIFSATNRGDELWLAVPGFDWAVVNFGAASSDSRSNYLSDSQELNSYGTPVRTIESRFLGFMLSDIEYPNTESRDEAWRKLQETWVHVLTEEQTRHTSTPAEDQTEETNT